MVILLVVIIVLAALFLHFCPPGRKQPEQFKDQGSISEKVFVEIGGVRQGMIIKGRDHTKPILLFLSGGPGIPDYFLARKYCPSLESMFVVCYWDYRGTGLSYDPNCSEETLTKEQFVMDTIDVTDYLRKRFERDQIYLMGHSFGTMIGLLAVSVAPEKYHSYIAMSQMADQPRSEMAAINTMIVQYESINNESMMDQLSEFQTSSPDEVRLKTWFDSPIRGIALHDLGHGMMQDMKSIASGVFFPLMGFRDYTIMERLHIWKGFKLIKDSPIDVDCMNFNAFETVPRVNLPVYFLAGRNDLTCAYGIQKNYFTSLEAPVKGFYSFDHSANSPLFEEPHKALRVLTEDAVRTRTDLRDKDPEKYLAD